MGELCCGHVRTPRNRGSVRVDPTRRLDETVREAAGVDEPGAAVSTRVDAQVQPPSCMTVTASSHVGAGPELGGAVLGLLGAGRDVMTWIMVAPVAVQRLAQDGGGLRDRGAGRVRLAERVEHHEVVDRCRRSGRW